MHISSDPTGAAPVPERSAGGLTSAATPLIELRGIRKSFGDLVVNDGVDLTLAPGEVHALLGENGAGKTTLMRILYGLTRPDSGEIRVRGERLDITSPKVAIGAGIGMVTQHFALVKPMTVTENIMLATTGLGRLDLAAAQRKVEEAAGRLGVHVNATARVGMLSVGEQQRVEIVKALYHDCRVLILDEPTAVLVPHEVEALFGTLRRLTAEGMAVLFISHKLQEVTEISHRVSVLRKGRIVADVEIASTTARELAELMVGRPTMGVRRKTAPAVEAPPVLSVRNLTVSRGGSPPDVYDVSLDVGAGEIVGVAGVSGNGQRELVAVLSGMLAPTSGTVVLDGVDISGLGPREFMAAGLGRIPEDRHASLVPELPVSYNLVLEHLEEFRRGPLLDERKIRRHAQDLIERFAIKARPQDLAGNLSGGNLQKVLLARVLSRDPKAIVVAQPTRGLDVGATEYVHSELFARRAAGAGILLVSEDLDELLALSDRIVVMYEGCIVGSLPASEATPAQLGLLMAGEVAA
jgi:simple sugar transport system ATP-binding protein